MVLVLEQCLTSEDLTVAKHLFHAINNIDLLSVPLFCSTEKFILNYAENFSLLDDKMGGDGIIETGVL